MPSINQLGNQLPTSRSKLPRTHPSLRIKQLCGFASLDFEVKSEVKKNIEQNIEGYF